MLKRIHIFGASGSGTTTLARALAESEGFLHLDTDDYFWEQADPPYQTIREKDKRKELLRQDLSQNDSWVLSGSLCGWGDFAISMFDMVVFLWLQKDIRMQRLMKRETDRFGFEIEKSDHPMNRGHIEFIEWAAGYDTGGLDMRSKISHERWISELPYSVLRLEGTGSIRENLETVNKEILHRKLKTHVIV